MTCPSWPSASTLGHGPASEPDLARWATLTRRQAAEATEAAAHRLAFVEVDGERLWFSPDAPEPPADPAYGALLLPLYDELTLSYPTINFPEAEGHPHPPGEDRFVGCVVVGDRNVGLWRRTVQGGDGGRRGGPGAGPVAGAASRRYALRPPSSPSSVIGSWS